MQLELKLTYFDVAVMHISHYTMRTLSISSHMQCAFGLAARCLYQAFFFFFFFFFFLHAMTSWPQQTS